MRIPAIDRHIPVPKPRGDRHGMPNPWGNFPQRLQPGDSVLLYSESAARSLVNALKGTGTYRKSDEGYRVWKV